MDKKLLFIGFFCLLVILTGCDTEKKGAHPQSQQSSTVVTGKIEPSAPSISEQKGPTPVDSPKDQPEMVIKTEKKGTETASGLEEPKLDSQKRIAPASTESVASLSSDLEEKAAVDDRAEVSFMEEAPVPLGYDPTGKVDPFKPLFSEAPTMQTPDDGTALKREKRRPATPLEMVDLSQLTLVGVVRSADTARALVEEINGKGYIVREGTYMGVNSGKVVQILQDKIIVEEEIENALGNISLQKRELKLQKPLGE